MFRRQYQSSYCISSLVILIYNTFIICAHINKEIFLLHPCGDQITWNYIHWMFLSVSSVGEAPLANLKPQASYFYLLVFTANITEKPNFQSWKWCDHGFISSWRMSFHKEHGVSLFWFLLLGPKLRQRPPGGSWFVYLCQELSGITEADCSSWIQINTAKVWEGLTAPLVSITSISLLLVWSWCCRTTLLRFVLIHPKRFLYLLSMNGLLCKLTDGEGTEWVVWLTWSKLHYFLSINDLVKRKRGFY